MQRTKWICWILAACLLLAVPAAAEDAVVSEEIEAAVNNQPYVIESVVIDRGARLVALVYTDSEKMKAEAVDVEEFKKSIMTEVNKAMPAYSKINIVEIMDQPFEKTPKMSIKRFMYK